jgi:hypothetical protein
MDWLLASVDLISLPSGSYSKVEKTPTDGSDYMSFGREDSVWAKKGVTFSDKSARDEFELTQEEILQAMREGKLQYRHNLMHGNPYWRLIRSEVEAYVSEKFGKDHLVRKNSETELNRSTEN